MLSVFGGLAGLVVAYTGCKGHRGARLPQLCEIRPHRRRSHRCRCWHLLSLLSLVTGVIFGTAPAWLTSHADPAEALRGANRSTRDTSSLSQKILVIVQATLSVVLLAGAGLLTRSLQNLQHQDLGLRNRSPRHDQPHRPILHLFAAQAGRNVPRAAGPPGSHSRSVKQAALALYTPLQDNWGEIAHS